MHYDDMHRVSRIREEADKLAVSIKNMDRQPHYFELNYASEKLPHNIRQAAIEMIMEMMVKELASLVWTLVNLGVVFEPLPKDPDEDDDDE